MAKGDNKAPQINIAAQRINQNDGRGEWAIFQIRTDVVDDFDPNPTVVVDPISLTRFLRGVTQQWTRTATRHGMPSLEMCEREAEYPIPKQTVLEANAGKRFRHFPTECQLAGPT